jgi:hypothetical protein
MQCRHVFTAGHRCASPCLRHEPFCYHHHTTRRPVANPAARRRRSTTFTLPELEDRASIQLALGEILQRIAANDLDPKRAGHLLYGLQIAASLLPKEDPKQQPKSVSEVTHDEELGDLAPAQQIGADREPTELERLLIAFNEGQQQPQPQPREEEAPELLPTLQAVAEQPESDHPDPLLSTHYCLLSASLRLQHNLHRIRHRVRRQPYRLRRVLQPKPVRDQLRKIQLP